MKKPGFTFIILFCSLSTILAQNTVSLEEGMQSPEATIDQLAWLEGHWAGEALGGTVEEVWAAPKAGAMMGMFRAEREGQISFYEFFTIREVDETLLLQIKHFQNDLVGWEEKNETVDFPLVKLSGENVWFDGLTMKLVDENNLTVYVRTTNREGEDSELTFNYRRVL